jgi:hypothetical protein
MTWHRSAADFTVFDPKRVEDLESIQAELSAEEEHEVLSDRVWLVLHRL